KRQDKEVSPTQTVITLTSHTYDDLGRLVRVSRRVRHSAVNNNVLTPWKIITDNKYDALGQLKEKKLGNKAGMADNNPVGKLEYAYNVRGWLLGINKSYMQAEEEDRYFSLELGYDKNAGLGTFTPLYNGNIAGMLWKSAGDGEKRKYDFSYDAANRLLKADFNQYAGSAGFDKSAGVDFSIGGDPATGGAMKYDANGNIKEMWQTGLQLTASPVIDKLSYTYLNDEKSNRLAKVVDGVTGTASGKLGDFKDGANPGDDYDYDANGNLLYDNNKDISSISYNHLNLPAVITVTGKGTITYSYDAAGNKLKKVTVESPTTANGNKTITTTTKYINGAVFESRTISPADPGRPDYPDRLLFISQPEGRLRTVFEAADPNVIKEFVDDYFVKDHLGNVRMVLTDEIKQDIYPAATLEGDINTDGSPNAAFVEKQYYTIDPTKIALSTDATGISAYPNHNGAPPENNNPNSNTTANSQKLYKLKATATEGVTGLGITLKVMAGDKIDIWGKSYYFTAVTNGATNNKNITTLSILTGLLGGPTGGTAAATHGGISGTQLNGIDNTTGGILSLFDDQLDEVPNSSSKPRAFINYIFFDEQFKSVGSGLDPVGDKDVVKSHQLSGIAAPKSGYVYIYVSNQCSAGSLSRRRRDVL
ncbi:MAG: hypothetical protein KF862_00005, partial [Chitinophagaceae bacterium]|nr:hypothetical protein [Chitinophagaceae bacterium]